MNKRCSFRLPILFRTLESRTLVRQDLQQGSESKKSQPKTAVRRKTSEKPPCAHVWETWVSKRIRISFLSGPIPAQHNNARGVPHSDDGGLLEDPCPDPQKDLQIRSPRTMGGNYIGVIRGLYRGSNFLILPGVWVNAEPEP